MVLEKRAAMETGTKIVAFASGKGGVGKSVLCANMANILTYYDYNILIIDLALGLANQDIIFNKNPSKNLLHFLKDEANIDEIEIKIKNNLTLLPSVSNDEILSFPPQIILHKILSKKDRSDIDYIFIDLNSDISIQTQSALELANEVIIITEPTPISIADAYATLKICDKLEKSTSIILNKTSSSYEGNLIFSKIEQVAKKNLNLNDMLSYLGSIDANKRIEKATKNRYLFTDKYPNNQSSYQTNEIIKKLIYKLEQKMLVKRRRKSLINILRRLIE